MFYVQVLQNKSLQYPLKNIPFLNYCTSKILFLNFFEKLSKMPKDKKLKTKARYENIKIDTFMFPQFKHISHLAKKIELLILVKNWEPRGRRRYTISTGLCWPEYLMTQGEMQLCLSKYFFLFSFLRVLLYCSLYLNLMRGNFFFLHYSSAQACTNQPCAVCNAIVCLFVIRRFREQIAICIWTLYIV